jgi:chaperonin GroES|uniref:Co-chaperonin GroES n=1 Tax=Thermodesulfovibrio aggregans TaxID=86166 RepID=A0A7C4AJ46_9BACT
MKIKPLKDRIVVKFSSEEMEKTPGGIYVPDVAKEKPQKGVVVEIGSEVKEVKVGDTVLFDKYAGSKIKVNDVEYLIIKEEEILGIIEK